MNKRIQKLSLSDPLNSDRKFKKLMEECGELAVESLKRDKLKKGKIEQHADLKEAIDVILVASSIFYSQGGTVKQFHQFIKEKSDKWAKKLQGRKNEIKKNTIC